MRSVYWLGARTGAAHRYMHQGRPLLLLGLEKAPATSTFASLRAARAFSLNKNDYGWPVTATLVGAETQS